MLTFKGGWSLHDLGAPRQERQGRDATLSLATSVVGWRKSRINDDASRMFCNSTKSVRTEVF